MGKLKNVIVTSICGAVLIGGGATLIVSQVEKSNCQKQINQMFETYNYSENNAEISQEEFVEENFSDEDKQNYDNLVGNQQNWNEYGDTIGASATAVGAVSVVAIAIGELIKHRGIDTSEFLAEIFNYFYKNEYGEDSFIELKAKTKETETPKPAENKEIQK